MLQIFIRGILILRNRLPRPRLHRLPKNNKDNGIINRLECQYKIPHHVLVALIKYSLQITSYTPATWSYIGDGLLEANMIGGLSGYYSAFISEVSKMNNDTALFEKVFAGSTFSSPAASSSYMTPPYYAMQSEREFLWDTDGDAAINFADMMTDGCLFTTCTNQYLSESSKFVSTKDIGLFYYTASAPCCGQCTILPMEYSFPTGRCLLQHRQLLSLSMLRITPSKPKFENHCHGHLLLESVSSRLRSLQRRLRLQ
ncbi:hypothetical protein BDZ45DRAFT_147439 [Acephala macrosclerotiorum]|nr:hypothetical protein BDZ45DRAFT_147439 [Acephala macrosclerotiorum]